MAITIIDKPPVLRRFLTYDLEWIPGEELYTPSPDGRSFTVTKDRTEALQHRLTGVFDGTHYRRYTSVDAFLSGELTSANRGVWFYAHAGGLADMTFVLDRIIAKVDSDDRYSVEASFSGSSAIIVHVKRGKNVWHFVDSYWLLRDSLEAIGRFIGIEKAAADRRRTKAEAREFYAHAPDEVLRAYNEVDCVILHKAVSAFETLLIDLGGQLQMTVASCALQLFRRRFLRRNIETDKGLNARAAEAYHASRVEFFRRRFEPSPTRPVLRRYDLNSSFPYAMTFPAPGECLGPIRDLPLGSDRLFLADVEVRVPETHVPPLPYRAHGRVFFPSGRWRGRYNNVDLEVLEAEGGAIEKVHEVIEFQPFDDLAAYASEIYRRRDASPEDSFEKIGYKYLGNALYGKFGESPFKSRIVVNPAVIDREGDPEAGIIAMEEYLPGVWRQDVKVPVAHAHVPISAHIVSVARRTLGGALFRATPWYCDTDSIDTCDELTSGRELGAFKHEATLTSAYYEAPKLYEYTAYWCYEHGRPDPKTGRLKGKSALGPECVSCGKQSEKKTVQRAKGFSEMDDVKFDLLVSGGTIAFQRMARLRELYGGAVPGTSPVEVLIQKMARGLTLPKRFVYPDGHTRPWTVEELTDGGNQAERFDPRREAWAKP